MAADEEEEEDDDEEEEEEEVGTDEEAEDAEKEEMERKGEPAKIFNLGDNFLFFLFNLGDKIEGDIFEFWRILNFLLLLLWFGLALMISLFVVVGTLWHFFACCLW